MSDFLKEWFEYWKDRTHSLVYRYFLVGLIAANARTIYITFFVENKFLTPNKFEYIVNHFYPNECAVILHFLIFPLIIGGLLLFLTLKPIAWLDKKLSGIYYENEADLKEVKARYIKKIAEDAAGVISAQTQLAEQKKQLIDISPEEAWKIDYQELSGKISHYMRDLENLIIDNKGYATNPRGSDIGSSSISFLLANNLIDIVDNQSSRKYSLTDKGKYFLKLYKLENTK